MKASLYNPAGLEGACCRKQPLSAAESLKQRPGGVISVSFAGEPQQERIGHRYVYVPEAGGSSHRTAANGAESNMKSNEAFFSFEV